MTYDLVVIGAGPGGFDCAVEAAGNGISVALVEKDSPGGTCLNRGCIPTKLWLGATSAIDELHNQAKMKVASGEVNVDFPALQGRVQKHLTGTRKAMGMQLKKLGIDLYEGFGKLAGEGKISVTNDEGETVLDYKKLVVATGSKPIYFPGLEPDGDCVLDSDMFLSQQEMPKSLIVVGAGFIGLEMAQVAHRMGAKVTVIDAMDRVAPLEDIEVSKALRSVFKRWKWNVMLEKRVAGVKSENGKAILTFDDREQLEADKILVAVGRGPVTEGIGLEESGIELERNQIKVDDSLQAAPNIYAIGDANGHIQLAHAASHQAHYVVTHLTGKTTVPYCSGHVPSVLYGSPEVMRVGIMENEAFLLNYDTTETSKAQLAANPMAQAHASTQGFVKIVWSCGKVIGITAVGHNVSQLALASTMIVQQGWTQEDVHKTIFAHPSLEESLKAALLAPRVAVQ